MIRHALPLLVCVTQLTAFGFGQSTHLVGPGGFAQIDDALAVCAPGDVVVVAPGNYAAFTAGIGVVIRALTPDTVYVDASSIDVPAQQALHLADLRCGGLTIGGSGTTTLDGCTTNATSWGATVLSGTVHFQDCTFLGISFWTISRPGLHATGGTITAIDSTFRGGNGNRQIVGDIGEGIRLQGCSFQGSNLTVAGGGSYHTSTTQTQIGPQPALRATNSSVWITDSSLTAGTLLSSGTPAACTVEATAGRLVRCQVSTAICGGIATGGPGLGVHRPAAYQTPGMFTLEFRTTPGDFVGVFANGELGLTALPMLEQALLLAPSTAVPFALLPSDVSGFATATWTLPAGLEDRVWWLQGFSNFSLPIQASALVGGLVR